MHFCAKDFDIFTDADGDSCKACMTGEVNGKKVTQDEYQKYMDYFSENLKPKFENLWTLIEPVLEENFGIRIRFNFEPKSQTPKMRPLCYAILSEEGIGQNRAQLNLRFSYDKRPNDTRRRRKFGVKFSLHHKCKEGLTNLDLQNFIENIESSPDRFIDLLKDLDDSFLVFKNYGEGIDDDYISVNQIEVDDLNDLFLARQNGQVYFQEIHKSLYWDDQSHREIIQNQNMLAMECVRAFVKLYPIYLYAASRGLSTLNKRLKNFMVRRKRNRSIFTCSRIVELTKKSLEIAENERIRVEDIFKDYVKEATRLVILDNYIPLKPLLCETIVDLCQLVENRSNCNIGIMTKCYSDRPWKEKKQLDENEFDGRLENLKKRLIALGFQRDRIRVEFVNRRERVLETNVWKIESGHPLDFYKKQWITYENNLTFSPKNRFICQ